MPIGLTGYSKSVGQLVPASASRHGWHRRGLGKATARPARPRRGHLRGRRTVAADADGGWMTEQLGEGQYSVRLRVLPTETGGGCSVGGVAPTDGPPPTRTAWGSGGGGAAAQRGMSRRHHPQHESTRISPHATCQAKTLLNAHGCLPPPPAPSTEGRRACHRRTPPPPMTVIPPALCTTPTPPSQSHRTAATSHPIPHSPPPHASVPHSWTDT